MYKEQQIPLFQKIESHLLEYETIVGEAVENGINVVTQVTLIILIIYIQ
jgi:hypothetical protein